MRVSKRKDTTARQFQGRRPVGRPRTANPRQPVGIRLDPAVRSGLVAAAEARGVGYQTLIHDILREWLAETAVIDARVSATIASLLAVRPDA